MESFRFGFDFPHIQMMAAHISKKVLLPKTPRRHRHRHRHRGGSKRPVVTVRTVSVTIMKKYTANTFSLQLKNGFDVLESV